MIKVTLHNEVFKVNPCPLNSERISQGDIIKNVDYIENIKEEEGNLSISLINFPYIIVLTQDCDLDEDFLFRKNSSSYHDKLLISVLVAPIYNAEQVCRGEHLNKIDRNMQKIDKESKKGKPTTRYKSLTENEIPRYHYLEFPGNIDVVNSIIDFKHYFSVNIEYLENKKKEGFVCQVSELYRERISQRFSSYLSRIGLP